MDRLVCTVLANSVFSAQVGTTELSTRVLLSEYAQHDVLRIRNATPHGWKPPDEGLRENIHSACPPRQIRKGTQT